MKLQAFVIENLLFRYDLFKGICAMNAFEIMGFKFYGFLVKCHSVGMEIHIL